MPLGLGPQLAGGRRFAGSPARGGREWPGIREVEFSGQDGKGRAGAEATPAPRSESPSFWARRVGGYRVVGSVTSGAGWDRVGA